MAKSNAKDRLQPVAVTTGLPIETAADYRLVAANAAALLDRDTHLDIAFGWQEGTKKVTRVVTVRVPKNVAYPIGRSLMQAAHS